MFYLDFQHDLEKGEGTEFFSFANWTYGNNTLYGLSMADETPANGEPQIMSPEEEAKARLDKAGFKCACEVKSVKPGDRIYFINKIISHFIVIPIF